MHWALDGILRVPLHWPLCGTLTGRYTECDCLPHSWPHAELWAGPQEAHLSRHFHDPNHGYGWTAEEFDSCIPGCFSGHLPGTEPVLWRKPSYRLTRAIACSLPGLAKLTVVLRKVDHSHASPPSCFLKGFGKGQFAVWNSQSTEATVNSRDASENSAKGRETFPKDHERRMKLRDKVCDGFTPLPRGMSWRPWWVTIFMLPVISHMKGSTTKLNSSSDRSPFMRISVPSVPWTKPSWVAG